MLTAGRVFGFTGQMVNMIKSESLECDLFVCNNMHTETPMSTFKKSKCKWIFSHFKYRTFN